MQWKALFTGDIVVKELPGENFLSGEFSMLMQEHVIRSCNFEAPVRGAGSPIRKAGPHLDQHPEAPSLLERAGFNVINLANNHIYDYGKDGLTATIAAFKNSVLVGAGANFEEAYLLKKIPVGNITVGLLSYCEAEFGALTVSGNEQSGYAWINHPFTNSIIIESRKQVDVLIIQVHAGVEQIDLPLPEWRERYRELVRLGADAVIASHPHVPQGFEVYKGKPIYYSLGNFYFDDNSTHPLWNAGIAVSLVFEGSQLVEFHTIPVRKTSQGLMIDSDQQFKDHLASLNKILEEPLYIEKINGIVIQLWDQYYRSYYDMALHGIHSRVTMKNALRHFIKRLLFRKKTGLNAPLLLHNIRIESHRWAVERVLAIKDHNNA